MAMVGATLDDEEIRRLKREAAIKQKDEEYKLKRVKEEEKKRQELERAKADYEAAEIRKAEEKVAMMKKQAKIRAQRKLDNEKLNAKRDIKIKQRHDRWLKKANESIQQIVKDHEAELDHEQEVLDKARARKHAKEQKAREAKAEAEIVQEELDMKRDMAISDLEAKRTIRAAMRVDAIKEEAQEELLSFIQNPFPVPLKQVLCGKIRPVPTTTELLAAHRDAREEFEDLKMQDFEMRAVVRNQSLFQYVHDVQEKAEALRISPPEPMASDLMKKGTRSPRSPDGKKGKNKGGARSQSPGNTRRFANRAPK